MKTLAGIKLIQKPESTVRKFFKQLFRDESIAAVFSGIVTLIAFLLVGERQEGVMAGIVFVAVLTLAGPVMEKGAFLIPYLRGGWQRYRAACPGCSFWWCLMRSPIRFWRFLGQELKEKEFLRILRADLLYHDTCYTLLMALGTSLLNPGSFYAAAFLGAASFGLAVVAAAYLEVGYVEFRFRRFLKRLVSIGGRLERFGELRFLVAGLNSAEFFLDKVRDPFKLSKDVKHQHCDWSVEGLNLPGFNVWKGYSQIRRSEEGLKLHIVYYQTRQVSPSKEGVAGFTFIEKIKVTILLDGEPDGMTIRKSLGPLASRLMGKEIAVKRLFSYNRTFARQEGVSFAIDTFSGRELPKPRKSLAEIKFWLNAVDLAGEARVWTSFLLQALETTQPRSFTPEMLKALPVMAA
jgi:hypothetical protein